MKSADVGLADFLFSKQGYVSANLYAITLAGGSVLRYTDADLPIVYGGFTYDAAVTISDGGFSQKRGLAVSALEVRIGADARHFINGVQVLRFARLNGFDGSTWVVRRIFYPDWGQAAVGSVIRFAGRFSEVMDADRAEVTVRLTGWTELLDVNMPVDVYQASCANTLYDSKCQVSRAAHTVALTVQAGSTLSVCETDLGAATGTYDLGSVKFLTGANAGLRRTVKKQTLGDLLFVAPLPAVPAAGDTLEIYRGCDLRMTTCNTVFSNLARFRGQPFIPTPETAL